MQTLLATLMSLTLWIFLYGRSQPIQTPWLVPTSYDTLQNPFSGNPKAILEGKKIYESTCWTCHGLSGKGDGPSAISINPKPSDHTSEKIKNETDGALLWKITKGRGPMPSYEQMFSRQQRWKLVCYIRELGKNQTEK